LDDELEGFLVVDGLRDVSDDDELLLPLLWVGLRLSTEVRFSLEDPDRPDFVGELPWERALALLLDPPSWKGGGAAIRSLSEDAERRLVSCRERSEDGRWRSFERQWAWLPRADSIRWSLLWTCRCRPS